MPTWNTLSEIVGCALRDLYSNDQRIHDRYWRLEEIDGDLKNHVQVHLAEAMLLNTDEHLRNLSVQVKPYVDAMNELKTLRVGKKTRLHVPSIVLHRRGTERYNTLAMLVKCDWKTDPKDLCTNYRGAVAFVLGRLSYPYALCVELALDQSQSKAFMTSKEHLLMSVGDERSGEMADELLTLAADYGLPSRWTEVVEMRDQLFIDVSPDLFGIRAAT